MKTFLMYAVLLQFLCSGLLIAQNQYTDIQEFKEFTRLSNLKEIQQKITVREKKKSLNQKDEIELVVLYSLYSSLLKNREVTMKFNTLMEQLIKKYPDNPIVIANYANSLICLSRDDTKSPEHQRINFFNRGMGIYNNALEGKFQNNFYIRLMRGVTCYMLPAFTNKLKVAQTDFEWMVKSYEKLNEVNHFGQSQEQKDEMAGCYLVLGKIYQRLGEMQNTKETLKKAVLLAPESKNGKEAKQILSAIE